MKTIACVVGTTLALAATAAPASAQLLPDLPPIVPPGGTNPPPPTPTAPVAPVGQAPGTVMEGLDVGNTNAFGDESIVPPLQRRWQIEATPDRTLVAADGKVFYVDAGVLHAIDQGTGARVWTAQLTESTAEPAYDGGIIVLSSYRKVFAHDAATGALKWSRDFTSNPRVVVAGGVVYLTDDGRALLAVKAADGTDLWAVQTPKGEDAGAPTVDDKYIYVPTEGGALRAYNRADGSIVWTAKHDRAPFGGGSRPTVAGGRVYPDLGLSNGGTTPVFDAASGAGVGTLPSRPSIFTQGLAVGRADRPGDDNDGIAAVDPVTGAERWFAKNGRAAIAVGHDIYGLGEGEQSGSLALYTHDLETGTAFGKIQLDKREVPSSDSSDPGIAVAPGALFVASTGYISAWESVLRPDPAGIALGFDTAVTAGKRATFVSMVGTSMKASKPVVALEIAGWRGGKFRATRASSPSFRDGSADLVFTPRRNTRVRARVGDAVSAPVTVYVWPNIRFGKIRWANRRLLRASHTVRTPGVSLKGARLVMYLDRRKTKTLTRITTARLRAAGRGRTRATMTFRPPRKVRSKDYLVLCLERGLSRGFGYPDNLTRRCGARSIRE